MAGICALSEALIHLRSIRPRGRLPWFHTAAALVTAAAVLSRLADGSGPGSSGSEGLMAAFMGGTGIVGLAGLVDVVRGVRRGWFGGWIAGGVAAGAVGLMCISWMFVVCPLLLPDLEAAWKYPFFATIPLLLTGFLTYSRIRREDEQAATASG